MTRLEKINNELGLNILDIEFIFNDDTMKELNIPKVVTLGNFDIEKWKFVNLDRKGHRSFTHELKYMISNYGRVYNVRKHQMVKEIKDTLFKTKNGAYSYVALTFPHHSSRHFKYQIHRLVMLAFVGIDKNRPIVNHIDGNPQNNYIGNLEWSTLSSNYIHALKTGLKTEPKGQQRYNAIFSDEEVHIVCKLLERGCSVRDVYNWFTTNRHDKQLEYNQVNTLCHHLKGGTHWKHIVKLYNVKNKMYIKLFKINAKKSAQNLGELKPL